MCVVRYADKYGAFYVHSFVFALFLRFMALYGFIFAFGAFLCLFLFLLQPTHPHPHFTAQNRWLPHSLIFLFFSFSKFFIFKNFFVEKCGMIYLHLVCVCVGTECLHLFVVCVELDWCLEFVVCVEFDGCVEF